MPEPKIRLTSEEMRYIALFESITGATSEDCVTDKKNGRILFFAKKGETGLAIGKNGKNINALQKMTGLQIEVVENAENPEELIKHSLSPARIKNIRIARARFLKKLKNHFSRTNLPLLSLLPLPLQILTCPLISPPIF